MLATLQKIPIDAVTAPSPSSMLLALQMAPIDATAGTEPSRMLATPQKIPIDAMTAPSPSSELLALPMAPIDAAAGTEPSRMLTTPQKIPITPRNAAADGTGPPRRNPSPQANAKPRSTSKTSPSTGAIPRTQVAPPAVTRNSEPRALDAASPTGPLIGTVQYKDRGGTWYKGDVRASSQQVFFRLVTITAAGKVVTTPAPGIRLRLFPTELRTATDIEPKPCVPETSYPPWDVDGTSFEDPSRRKFFSAGMKATTVLLSTKRVPVKSVNPDCVPPAPLA
ncbi:hypothetical protein T484DRAFT_1862524 [Cryptophyta sp. CCMP2293]|nr:hypothetical protein T484DRAFT_1862524 [Cryptophyta sp. CCMP2293]